MCVLTQGQYVIEIGFFGYNNPTGRCAECPIPAGQTLRSCCDDFVSTTCTDAARCDSFFYFCLRALGDRRTTNGCTYPGSNVTFANTDDASLSSTTIRSVLGLDNPFQLPGLTTDYNVCYNIT